MDYLRLKNRTIAKVITRFPSLSRMFINSYSPRETEGIPWIPVTKLLQDSRIAIVTTAGVHHKDQKPFDMHDPEGDPTFRVIDVRKPLTELMITHDYYDHSDADKDINIVFPVERLREFVKEGIIGKVADMHYGFMGHIDGHHIQTLIKEHAPEIAKKIKTDNVDVVLLTPG
jgi:D-proline reductase (dithiol) PrdB